MCVSVIIPAFDAIELLGEAIASALSQSRPPDQVIVVNDGSPRTQELEQAIAPFRSRILYFWQPNGGAGAARNAGLAAARHDLVAFLDADDCWDREYLDRQLAVFEGKNRVDVAYCDGWIGGTTPLAGRRFMEVCPSKGAVTVGSLLDGTCTVLTSGVVARTARIRDVGGFDASLRRGQDFDLWLRLARAGARFAVLPLPLVYRRVHVRADWTHEVGEHQRVLDVLAKPCWWDLSAQEQELLQRRVNLHRRALSLVRAKAAIAQGRYAAARDHLGDAAGTGFHPKLWAARLVLCVSPGLLRRALCRRDQTDTVPQARTISKPTRLSPRPREDAAARTIAGQPRAGQR
jgi:glycosyltransferase involved in cell wall biosynthesis